MMARVPNSNSQTAVVYLQVMSDDQVSAEQINSKCLHPKALYSKAFFFYHGVIFLMRQWHI